MIREKKQPNGGSWEDRFQGGCRESKTRVQSLASGSTCRLGGRRVMNRRRWLAAGLGDPSACGVGSREYLNERLSRDPDVCVGNKRTKEGGAARTLSSAPGSEE